MTEGLSQLLSQIPAKVNAFLDEFRDPDSVGDGEESQER